jgi:hypothetical protein
MSNKNSSGGVGVLGLLGVVFVALKLTGYIDWSWWYVTMPFWGGFAVIAVLAAVFGAVWVVAKLIEGARK